MNDNSERFGGPPPNDLWGWWQEAEAEKNAWIEEERRRRFYLAGSVSNGFADLKLGTNRFPLQGHTIKIVCSNRTTVPFKTADDRQRFEATIGALPEHISNAVFRWKPELDANAYKALSAEHKKIVDNCLLVQANPVRIEQEPAE